MNKPIFSQNLFWDVEEESLNMDKHKAFIVARVLDYGSLEDFVAIRDYYTIDGLGKISVNIRSLMPNSLSFISVVTNIKITEFRCYKLSQLTPQHWGF